MDWGVALDMDTDMDVDMDMDTDIHIDLGAGRQAADTSGHCCPPSVSQSFGPCRLAAAARIPKEKKQWSVPKLCTPSRCVLALLKYEVCPQKITKA